MRTRTDRSAELAYFYEHVLGLKPVHAEPDVWIFELLEGRMFGVRRGLSQPCAFSTGPVAGFAMCDLPAAVEELRRAGIEMLGEPEPSWQHFRGPTALFMSSSLTEPCGQGSWHAQRPEQ